MNGDRIKLLYDKIKNTTNKIDKQNLLVELGDVIVTYGSDKATKLDFIVMYCASVERADPHVVDFILKYDYKKTPSYFNKTWGFFSKFTKVASQAQNAFSSFETLTSGNELDEIIKKIEEEKKKEKPDNDYLEVLDNQKDQILLNTGNNFFEFMGNLGSAVPGIGLLVEEYFDAGKGILSYGYKVVKEHKEKLQTILNELEDSNKKESGKENLINEIRSESNFILTVVKNIQAFKDSELISIIKDRDRENHIKGLFNTYEQEIIDLEKTIKSISAKIKELANYELSGNNVLSLSSSFIESSHRYVKQNLDISVQNYDPLIVDLGNDGFNMKSLENGVYFDLDRNNTKEKTTWVDKNDALLAIDLDANGRIDNGQELFGDYFKMPDDSYATSSIQALSSLDSNKDGEIDSVLFRIIGITDFCKEHIGQFLC